MYLLVFIAVLFIGSVFLPAVFGFTGFSFVTIFILSLFFYDQSERFPILKCAILFIIAEFVSGISLGSLTVPFLMIALFYSAIDRAVKIRPEFMDGFSSLKILVYIVQLVFLILVYELFFMIYDSNFNWHDSVFWWLDFLRSTDTMMSIIMMSVIWTVLFKYFSSRSSLINKNEII